MGHACESARREPLEKTRWSQHGHQRGSTAQQVRVARYYAFGTAMHGAPDKLVVIMVGSYICIVAPFIDDLKERQYLIAEQIFDFRLRQSEFRIGKHPQIFIDDGGGCDRTDSPASPHGAYLADVAAEKRGGDDNVGVDDDPSGRLQAVRERGISEASASAPLKHQGRERDRITSRELSDTVR